MKVFLNNKKTEILRRTPAKQDEVDERDGMLREIAIMKKLHHPHLIHLKEVCFLYFNSPLFKNNS